MQSGKKVASSRLSKGAALPQITSASGHADALQCVDLHRVCLYVLLSQALHGWCPLRDPKTGRGGRGALHIHAEFEAAGQSSLGIKVRTTRGSSHSCS
jgi:hypothetical protein